MKAFVDYIAQTIDTLQQEAKELADSERKDESNLVKIRINIYEIAKTVLQVVAKSAQGPELQEIYFARLDAISGNWKLANEKAKEHGDVEKSIIEELKLDTLKEIQNKFMELREKE